MKKKSLFITLAVVIAAATAAFVSCKKENVKEQVQYDSSKAAAMMQSINRFREIRDAVNAGAKSNGVMTVEEMRHYIDLTFNFEHSEHQTYCTNTVLDTFYVAMPEIDVDGNVTEMAAVNTYNAFETELQILMQDITDGRDVPSCFSIIMPEIGAKDVNNIQVIFTRGEESLRPDNLPNGSDFCLYWGYGLGAYDPASLTLFDDATDYLSRLFEFSEEPTIPGSILILGNLEYVTYVAFEYAFDTLGWVYWEPTTTPSCADHWLYVIPGEFIDDEPYICWDELMCYYNNVNNYVENTSGALHYSPTYHSPYFECSFDWHHLYNNNGFSTMKRSVRIHSLRVKYADYYWYNPSID